ncbi:hypothetical protein LTR99_003889 [Exophiala xenobiotica]|uniref:Uncharacterized protein n=1 Tax=Vermiconidia calcicola TaxID=1690605 RepID=A0AAV9PW23_9PEZI|nr:hypothetical protein LTR41_009308 [Exophiala xenobiotica]KAK5529792.1 hypothetical protein LTR25_009571 [Vermiconidia calcicola]KAK5549003.1 hypothetical protein LTR23_000833 [Chaetothyriales sp. CCFEE 6169]KAK5224140.1 hypothetical protein LTR47_010021 [Exophiala xenobiotica]KAK5244070.1 hypothetical protein LTS06_010297 [Exophiala xenobiotica]
MPTTEIVPKTENMPNSPGSVTDGEDYVNLAPPAENPTVGVESLLVTDAMHLSERMGRDKRCDGTVIAKLMVPGPVTSGPRECKMGHGRFEVDSEYLFLYYNETPHLCFGSDHAEKAFLATAHERGIKLPPASVYPLSMALSFCPAPRFRSSLPAGDHKRLMEVVKETHSKEVSGRLIVGCDPATWAETMALHLHKRIMDPELSQVSVNIDEGGKAALNGITHVSGQLTDAWADKETAYATISFAVCANLRQERCIFHCEIAELNRQGIYFYTDDEAVDVGRIQNVPEARTAPFDLQEFLRSQPWALTAST